MIARVIARGATSECSAAAGRPATWPFGTAVPVTSFNLVPSSAPLQTSASSASSDCHSSVATLERMEAQAPDWEGSLSSVLLRTAPVPHKQRDRNSTRPVFCPRSSDLGQVAEPRRRRLLWPWRAHERSLKRQAGELQPRPGRRSCLVSRSRPWVANWRRLTCRGSPVGTTYVRGLGSRLGVGADSAWTKI